MISFINVITRTTLYIKIINLIDRSQKLCVCVCVCMCVKIELKFKNS